MPVSAFAASERMPAITNRNGAAENRPVSSIADDVCSVMSSVTVYMFCTDAAAGTNISRLSITVRAVKGWADDGFGLEVFEFWRV